MHVKVFGSMRQYENKRHVLIYKITPLTDFNEMTHHMLETVLVHLQNTQGPIPGSAAAMVGATPRKYIYMCISVFIYVYNDMFSASI